MRGTHERRNAMTEQDEEIVLQDTVTLMGKGSTTEAVQHEEMRRDVTGRFSLMLVIRVLKNDGGNLEIQTAPTRNCASWRTTVSAAASTTELLRREMGRADRFLDNFLRWKAIGTGDWQITFRVTLVKA